MAYLLLIVGCEMSRPSRNASLLHRQDGSTFVEYVIVLGFVALVVGAAMAALGVPLLKHYRFVQFVISAPIP